MRRWIKCADGQVRRLSPRPLTISRGAFMALRRGDVVRWGRHGWRIVLEGPDDRAVNARLGSVVFAKWQRGRYGGFTCYGWGDVNRKIAVLAGTLPDRVRRALAEVEAGRLVDMGFSPEEESRRAISDARRCVGLGLQRFRCDRWPRTDDVWSRLPAPRQIRTVD